MNQDDLLDETDMSILTLLEQTESVNEELFLFQHGYRICKELAPTLQGSLYKAEVVSKEIDKDKKKKAQFVAIKRASKLLSDSHEVVQDGFHFCVAENIQNEAAMLRCFALQKSSARAIASYVVDYVDFFQSDSAYYLVLEYVPSEMNLKQFVSICHRYIARGTLKYSHYRKIIKFLLWQLCVTVTWLHQRMKCAHLDLMSENVMLKDVTFAQDQKGNIQIDNRISVKLCDFGAAETFESEEEDNSGDIDIDVDEANESKQTQTDFRCAKQGVSMTNEAYFAPQVFEGEIYDARAADSWCLGMMLFECLTGRHLYEGHHIAAWQSRSESVRSNGYSALRAGELPKYLHAHNLHRYFSTGSLSLLLGLLAIEERERLTDVRVLRHAWFASYYEHYKVQSD